jgi:hypothetical protein
MRKLALTLTLTSAVLAAVVAAQSAEASAPVVPLRAQHAIARRTALYAYAPARLPVGFHYEHWTFSPKPAALRIWFKNRSGWEITFVASPQTGPCDQGKEKSFQLSGNKVFWSHTRNEQQAWRCVTGVNGKQVRLTAATAQPSTKFSDSGLGGVSAAGKRIG